MDDLFLGANPFYSNGYRVFRIPMAHIRGYLSTCLTPFLVIFLRAPKATTPTFDALPLAPYSTYVTTTVSRYGPVALRQPLLRGSLRTNILCGPWGALSGAPYRRGLGGVSTWGATSRVLPSFHR